MQPNALQTSATRARCREPALSDAEATSSHMEDRVRSMKSAQPLGCPCRHIHPRWDFRHTTLAHVTAGVGHVSASTATPRHSLDLKHTITSPHRPRRKDPHQVVWKQPHAELQRLQAQAGGGWQLPIVDGSHRIMQAYKCMFFFGFCQTRSVWASD